VTTSSDNIDVVDFVEEKYTRLLTRTLIHAFYWMDDGLQNYMLEEAGFSLPRAQSMMMICIGDGICRQSDISKHLRVSKQAIRQSVKELESKGLVVIKPDPQSGRQKVLSFTAKGEQMREIASCGLSGMERILEKRLGSKNMLQLHRVFELDWGAVPSAAELIKELTGE
jgi:DNA-binding MarR family transcriptional regulator